MGNAVAMAVALAVFLVRVCVCVYVFSGLGGLRGVSAFEDRLGTCKAVT